MTEMQNSVRVSAKALIKDQDKYLVIWDKAKRKIYGDLPGGKIEFGETPEQTVVREVFEELGIKIKVEKFLGHWQFISVHSHTQVICLTFLCSLVDANHKTVVFDSSHNPACDEEIVDHAWVDKEKIADQKYVGNTSLQKMIEETLP